MTRPWRQAARFATTTVSTCIVLAAVVVICAAVVIPRVGDATPYTILTGSMQPKLPPGTLVVIRPVPMEEIREGTVITYQLKSGKPTVVTHRVNSVGVDTRGKFRFRTQGDANDIPDATPVRPEQIKGALWYDVPYLGYANTYITGKERRLTMIVVVSGLLLYAAFMFTSSARDRFGRRRHRATVGAP